MEALIIPKSNPDTEAFFRKLMENAFGLPIAFSAAPTLASMAPNTWGFSGNDIYIKTSTGTGIKITGASF